MADVEIKLEREGTEGIVPEGTYLLDAMKRIGFRPDDVCSIPEKLHFCTVVITEGGDLLSGLTGDEREYLDTNEHRIGERLACQVIVEKAGEIAIMTNEPKEEDKAVSDTEEREVSPESYRKTFEEMPLEKKIASLVRLEAIALGETVSFVVNSPFMIFEKIGDVMAEFGLKLEKSSKASKRPKEHAEQTVEAEPIKVDADDVTNAGQDEQDEGEN